MQRRELGRALDWIRATPEIRDVLLTGGDPLVFSDERLGWLLGELRAIPHVEIMRLGTRYPVTLPFRVTRRAVRAARASPPDLAEHPLQPPAGADRRGGRGLRPAAARGHARSATRACCSPASTTTSPP